MGIQTSSRSKDSKSTTNAEEEKEVEFEDFDLLRSIGKGAFGKVCIVKHKESQIMYALKYMSKEQCIAKDSVRNVVKEIDILQRLHHPFLVNLWFAFQDDEDMFMVIDIFLGGDLRFHMSDNTKFDEYTIAVYMCEIGLSLDYMKSKRIIHRDIKPDNILLDEKGHIALTDFNVATELNDGKVATTMSGTKPYMAPEMFEVSKKEKSTIKGYTYEVDWWATGITLYELMRKKRPFEITGDMNADDCIKKLDANLSFSSTWSIEFKDILSRLLTADASHRLQTLEALKEHPFMEQVDFELGIKKALKPTFIPKADKLNCDPTYELEEMIVESKPLHKKKKRLKKKKSADFDMNDPMQKQLYELEKAFRPYNRVKRLAAEEAERKRKHKEELDAFAKELAHEDEDEESNDEAEMTAEKPTIKIPSSEEPEESPNGTLVQPSRALGNDKDSGILLPESQDIKS